MIKRYDARNTDPEILLARPDCSADISALVAEILKQVELNGDAALLAYTERFDKAKLRDLAVSSAEIQAALEQTDTAFLDILREAAANIHDFHGRQKRSGFLAENGKGKLTGQRVLPLERVGIYVPGGTAAYPSSVLMNCIPAKIAGCPEIVMCTPPLSDGSISPNILAAAHIAGVNRIFKVGGAQAIAALARGTESIPKVDKIVGPGNAYVAEAKKQVFGLIGIDSIAGPSEILIIADASANPRFVAADLLSQAEHDRMASAILITDSPDFAEKVEAELERRLPLLARHEIARHAIDVYGKIIICRDNFPHSAIALSNRLAPEHLELCLAEPLQYLPEIQHAASVFLGSYCPEALGDYFAGPNHTLPTGGSARFFSPLSVDDFVKTMQFSYFSKEALASVAEKVACFAEYEGLGAHAESLRVRFEQEQGKDC